MITKTNFLPKELASIYFLREDIDTIKDTWSSDDALKVAKKLHETLSKYLETEDDSIINDINTCPFCILAEDRCNKCGYFTYHGTCLNPHSTYEKVTKKLWEGKEKELGIMDYILESYGRRAIEMLFNSIKIIEFPVDNNDPQIA
jgi:hypothetical protein